MDADGKDVFCIQLERKFTTKKNLQGKALLGLLGLALNSEKPVPIGYFKGMELQIQHLPLATNTMQDWLALVHIALSWELMC